MGRAWVVAVVALVLAGAVPVAARLTRNARSDRLAAGAPPVVAPVAALRARSGASDRLAAGPRAGARARWKGRIDRVAAGHAIAIAVARRGRLVYARAARSGRVPASNQKLLLTMALLDELGPAARIETLAAARRLPGGRIRGDLWLVGRGDPSVASSARAARALGVRATRLGRLARRIAAAGVQRIHGSVVGSTGYFRHDWNATGWRPDFPGLYVALPSALTLDGNVHRGRPTRVPEQRAARVLTARLEALGVSVGGRPRAGRRPPSAHVLARVRARPLRALLRHMNHSSSNFFAEVLGKRLAVERFGAPGTIARGARALAAWARGHGVRVRAHDASGLSFANRISARGVVRLLAVARRAPWGRALRRSLPSGGEGTLEERLSNVGLRAKTGTLDGVSALSGYVWQARRGGWAEFALLSRGMPKDEAVRLENRIVHVIARPRGGQAPALVAGRSRRPLA
jgi:D-alanyl-D-alanine carboxypeptidase/D-alanyl-D-alanine-endopeptidase (penicillin-binding protein 4)